MGHTATHAVVLARLITKGVDHGIHPFIMQIRSLEDHTPLPGTNWGGGCKTTSPFITVAQDNRLKFLSWLSVSMPTGVRVGDIGPKFGGFGMENGFLQLDHVRIPRDHMLMKYSKVHL